MDGADLKQALQKWVGVVYHSDTSYRALLHRCGFSYQRSAKVFRSRSTAQVAEFEEQPKKLMDIAQFAPETVILAEDEASLYLQATTTAVWAPLGQTPTVRAHPGRDKVNFYGTLNLHSGQTVATRAEKMNSTATALHLEHVLSAYPDVPILLLWDRAPWHGGAAVRAVLQANSRRNHALPDCLA